MRCASCNHDNPADALFCMKCGTKVERRCSSCDTVNPADANEVVGVGALHGHFELAARRGLTKFVGREREQMKHALEQSICGHGQVVAVMAEAGTVLGSSSIILRASLAARPGWVL